MHLLQKWSLFSCFALGTAFLSICICSLGIANFPTSFSPDPLFALENLFGLRFWKKWSDFESQPQHMFQWPYMFKRSSLDLLTWLRSKTRSLIKFSSLVVYLRSLENLSDVSLPKVRGQFVKWRPGSLHFFQRIDGLDFGWRDQILLEIVGKWNCDGLIKLLHNTIAPPSSSPGKF